MAQESGPCSYMENHVECANTTDLWLANSVVQGETSSFCGS